MSQDVNGLLTRYLLDLQPGLSIVLAETTGANVIRNVHAPRGIHAHKDAGGAWEWMMQDGLGSVRGVVDNTVGVLWSGSPAPFGEYFGESGTRQTSYGFTGEQTDGNGQVYLRARYYNPSVGTFLSLDPFEGKMCRPMSLNGYLYVEGNPVMNTDPSGMQVAQSCMESCLAQYQTWSQKVMHSTECFIKCFSQTSTPQPSTPVPTLELLACPTPPSTSTPTLPPFATNTPPPTGTPIPPTPTLDPLSECEVKLLAVSTANEAGAGGYSVSYIVAHASINLAARSSIEAEIRNGQISLGLLSGFNQNCPQLGDAVYSFYTDPNQDISIVGDIPRNIVDAERAARDAWSSTDDPTNGSPWFYVSPNIAAVTAIHDALVDLQTNPTCAQAWINRFGGNPNVTPSTGYVENNGVAVTYSNFVPTSTLDLIPQLGWAGCSSYCRNGTCNFG